MSARGGGGRRSSASLLCYHGPFLSAESRPARTCLRKKINHIDLPFQRESPSSRMKEVHGVCFENTHSARTSAQRARRSHCGRRRPPHPRSAFVLRALIAAIKPLMPPPTESSAGGGATTLGAATAGGGGARAAGGGGGGGARAAGGGGGGAALGAAGAMAFCGAALGLAGVLLELLVRAGT